MDKIDLVVLYVDSTDKEWQELFEKYNPHLNEEGVDAPNRFRGQGDFFRFFFRCVEKNMSWINKVHLVVQSESQVPKWINRDTVHVVLHEDFIPREFLPVFNSTAIEMFLWNIPGLSEKFIYANDDIFAIGPVLKSHFFKDISVITNIFNVTRLDTMYYTHVDNSYKEIYRNLQKDVVTVGHSLRPYFKSDMASCFKEHEQAILNSISKFRERKNFNVYLYTYDLKRKDKLVNSNILPSRICSNATKAKSIINNSNVSIICIQDSNTVDSIYENRDLISVFLSKFKSKSKYELTDFYLEPTKEQLKTVEQLVSKLPDDKKEFVKSIILKSLSM